MNIENVAIGGSIILYQRLTLGSGLFSGWSVSVHRIKSDMLDLPLYIFQGSIPVLREFLSRKCKILLRSYEGYLKFNAFFGMCLLFLSIVSPLASADEVSMDFNDGVYFENEWVVTDHKISALYIPYERSPFTYSLNKGDYLRIKGVSMDMQLSTTIGVARANVYMECGGTRDGFQMNTYPHPQLWKNARHWKMSDHCLEILNEAGEVSLLVKVYWDGHGVFQLLDLKMEAE